MTTTWRTTSRPLPAGLYFYHALQDRFDERGVTPDADSGLLRRFNTGETTDVPPFFAENRFHFGRLSIVPGMRLEFFEQSLDENVNITRAPGDPLLSSSDFSFVPLFSLGVNYVLVEGQVPGPMSMIKDDSKSMKNVASMVAGGSPRLKLYATVAQAYRPRTYGELVSTAPDGVVNGDLVEGDSLQFELGLRGKPLPYLTFDVGGFYFEVNDQVGEITGVNAAGATFTTTQNVGDARYAGFEAAVELDLLAMINGGTESPYGRFNLYGNVTCWMRSTRAARARGSIRPTPPIIRSKSAASIAGRKSSKSVCSATWWTIHSLIRITRFRTSFPPTQCGI